jgi:SAM-dependent methyltransferase
MTTDVGSNVAAASTERYAADWTLGMYLHAEWADLLTPDRRHLPTSSGTAPGTPALPPELARTSTFYRDVAGLVAGWIEQEHLRVRRLCDVGAGTGRTVYELAARLPQAPAFTLVEPSRRFAAWGRRLLSGVQPGLRLPVPAAAGQPGTVVTTGGTTALARPVEILTTHAEDVAAAGRTFDVVTSLNVLDRVPDPGALVRSVARLVRPGGLLVVASPLDFETHYTPEDRWVDDIRALLAGVEGEVVASVDVPYTFLQHSRRFNWFLSQVVCVRLPASGVPHARDPLR